MPARWTDIAEVDPFAAISDGRRLPDRQRKTAIARMAELLLKLFGPVIPVVAALIQLGRENGWLGGDALRGQPWTFALIGTIILGGLVNSGMTWHGHENEKKEREKVERAAQDREQQAQRERREIAAGVKKVELALGREHDPNLTLQEALGRIGNEVKNLQERASTLDYELEGLRKYGEVAKLNVLGVTGRVGGGLTETSRTSRALEGAYDTKTREGVEKLEPRCDDEGVAKFEQVAKQDPTFPFAHWAIAGCLQKTGNPRWRSHVERAMEILDHTTQIAGHHPHHSEVRQHIARWFSTN